ncbi:hypothetical protein [Acaryochloris thomasi]|uniref:hypothetical protein n=1 Tax=Acaryochloris thomasi TaxID=2929456 RepID=UPI0011B67FF4|nr:hypothetical protein [Acaryochloris thomasi]
MTISSSKTESLLLFLEHIQKRAKSPEAKRSLCFETPMPVCYRSVKYLDSHNGNYLNNQFSAQLKSLYHIKKTQQEEHQKKILFHIRLGDVANLELLPEKIFIPWCYAINQEGFINLSEQTTHYRHDHLSDFSLLSQRLCQEISETIEIIVVTDGYSTSFDYISGKRELVEYLKSFNLNFNKSTIRDLKSKYRKYFHRKFSGASQIIYGEEVELSLEAIKQIASADIVISSSGHFALGLMNNFAIKKQDFFSPKITYLASQRNNSRKNLTAHLLSDSIENNVTNITQLIESSSH